ncbi:MAG: adenylate kinase [Dehalococcoidia bacterium]|nr:adenylate kinase [Dehalococcoidia bacterium]
MNVILMGPPGSGKGTQAANLAEKLGVSAVSSGDLFRDHQRRNTELGQLARSYMERGVYVPDDVTIGMIMEWINDPDHSSGFVLDGFPRTQAQAEALDDALEDRGGIDHVVLISVSDDELVRRLGGRLTCDGCQIPYNLNTSPPLVIGKCDDHDCDGTLYQRDDDKAEVVARRIEVYNQETQPILDYYREAGILSDVDGEQSVGSVGDALQSAVNA